MFKNFFWDGNIVKIYNSWESENTQFMLSEFGFLEIKKT